MLKLMGTYLSAITCISLLAACATTGSQQQEPARRRKPISHPAPASKTGDVQPVKIEAVSETRTNELDYAGFFEKVSSPNQNFTEKDRQQFLAFPANPQPGTLHEAAIVVGILRDIVTPIGGHRSTFREVDMAAAQNAENSSSVIDQGSKKIEPHLILETRCREKGVDLITAISTNPHLRSYAIYNLTLDASRFDGNSPLFLQNLLNALKTETQSWGDLARKMGMDVQPVGAEGTLSPQSPSPEAQAPTITASPEENSVAHQIMTKATEYAGKEDYEKAVVEARKVPQGTDHYASAQESLKGWANRAVQDLRRQAASQYRSSSSMPESTGKKSHLQKAKNYLEIAITKYPEASTLDTVKENLEIINKELERLK